MQIKLVNPNYEDNYLENLLAYRGVEDLNTFLNPSPNELEEPELLDNIEEGFKLYIDTIKKRGRIALVVDCDCDGFTSGTIIYQYTKRYAPHINIDYYIHTKKQHGLEDMIDELMLAEPAYDLVICPDSSSNDKDYHEALGGRGTRTLVLDHHILDDMDTSPYAVIINNQISERYKNKELTGAGVTYQFCRYCDKMLDLNNSSDLIDLAALGVCGDMGSVLELENRYIMKYGFSHITNKFFSALVDRQSYSMGGICNPTTVAFYIVPLINAMIRVGTEEEKNRMFVAFIDGDRMVPCNKRGAKGTLEKVAIESTRECINARSRQNKLLDTNTERLEIKAHKEGLLDNKILIITLDEDDEFPSEINGLLAMRLSQHFKKPTIVVRPNPSGYLRGSIRGLQNSPMDDFRQFLIESGDCEYVSGHAQAAGVSFKQTDLDKLQTYANNQLKGVDFGEGCYEVNFTRYAADEDLKDMIMDLGAYPEVWGQGNPETKIFVKDINISQDDIQVLGTRLDTLKIEKFGVCYMKFFAKDLIEELRNKGSDLKLNIVGHANINRWGGRVTPQVFIDAYEVLDGTYGF